MSWVGVHHRVAGVAAEWDAVVRGCGSPIFYSSRYLHAYEQAPLAAVKAHAYLMLRRTDGTVAMVAPAALQHEMDPLGVLARYHPGVQQRPSGLLSHVWHCYDTLLPAARLDRDDVAALLEGLRETAGAMGAAWYGFVNVDSAGPLARCLTELGLPGVEIDERYVLDVGGWHSVEDYLHSLVPKRRKEICRHQRRADEAGVQVRTLAAAEADLDELFVLVPKAAAKHNNEAFYRDGIFMEFVRHLGDAARILEVRIGSRLVSGSICLLDDRRYHFWTCGLDYAAAPTFSPFYVLFLATVHDAFALDLPVMECGRRNGLFKSRYGMRRHVLTAHIAATSSTLTPWA